MGVILSVVVVVEVMLPMAQHPRKEGCAQDYTVCQFAHNTVEEPVGALGLSVEGGREQGRGGLVRENLPRWTS